MPKWWLWNAVVKINCYLQTNMLPFLTVYPARVNVIIILSPSIHGTNNSHGYMPLHVRFLEQHKRQQEHTISASSSPRQSARRKTPSKTQRGLMSPLKKFWSIERNVRFFQPYFDANAGTVPVNRLELSVSLCMLLALARPAGIVPPMALNDKSRFWMLARRPICSGIVPVRLLLAEESQGVRAHHDQMDKRRHRLSQLTKGNVIDVRFEFVTDDTLN